MANPVLREEVFNKNLNINNLSIEKTMTPVGTLTKTCILGLLLALTFGYTWSLIISGFSDKAVLLTNIGIFGGLITAIIVCFAPKNNFLSVSTSIYAMFEGLALGSVSAIVNSIYPGIVLQAIAGTIFAVFGMFFLYSTKLVKNTPIFQRVIMISTFAICGVYLLQIILNFFNLTIPGIFTNSPVGILFSVVVIAVASFNLIIDFDFIERYSNNAPAYMEWYGAFSLMITIVWLYIEILNLLAKLNSRR